MHCNFCLEEAEEKEEDTQMDTGANDPSQPRQLHKTQSIFLRNLAPSITKNEIENVCFSVIF